MSVSEMLSMHAYTFSPLALQLAFLLRKKPALMAHSPYALYYAKMFAGANFCIYKCLASLLAIRQVTSPAVKQMICRLPCSLSFLLLQSLIMCLRGAHSSSGKLQLTAGDI